MSAPSHRLQRLVYRSRQSPLVVADLEFEVCNIVRSSIRNNRLANLSGLLVTIQGYFIQVLEGPPERLEEAYRRISADPRHLDLEVISSEPAARRLFRDWEMCAQAVSPSDAVIVESLDRREQFDPAGLTARSALRLLSAVAQVQRQASLRMTA
jgi:hypothetical protein